MKFYSVRNLAAWGDYGDILRSGYCHRSETEGQDDQSLLRLSRTGPFVPPISFPSSGVIVVTDEFREILKRSGIGDFQFHPVVKHHIVEYHWETWDLQAEYPQEFPESGEPEDYLQKRPHSPETARQLGDLWEVLLPRDATVETVPKVGHWLWAYDLVLDASTWTGPHLFVNSAKGSKIIASEVGKSWLKEHAGEWVRLTPVLTERPPQREFYVKIGSGPPVLEEPPVERLREIVAAIGSTGKARRAELAHRSGWCLSIYHHNGNVSFRNLNELRRGSYDMSNVPKEKALELWLSLAKADIERVASEGWSERKSFLF